MRQGLLQRYRELVGYLASIIRAGVDQGRFRADVQADSLAALLVCTADAVTVYWVAETPELDIRAMRLTLLAMLRSFLIATPVTGE